MRSYLRRLFSSRHGTQGRPAANRRRTDCSAEVLEARVMLAGTGAFGSDQFEIVGRANNGNWWASGTSGGSLQTEAITHWSAAIPWHLDQAGDIDGDGLDDVASRDSQTGNWWTSLSNGKGSLTTLATNWSTALQWNDVEAIDVDEDGLDDLLGRASNGQWWAAISRGDGTFYNRLMGYWTPTAGWRDVQTSDIDHDGDTDVIGRTAAGHWWSAIYDGGEFENRLLGAWSEAGWRDVRAVDIDNDYNDEIIGRTASGQWWASEYKSGVFHTAYLGAWSAIEWRDVAVANVDTDATKEIIGRTANGDWWVSEWKDGRLYIAKLGNWVESGWQDVTTADIDSDGRSEVIGRASGGTWWASTYQNATTGLTHRMLGSWVESAGWSKALFGRFTAEFVNKTSYDSVEIRAHRNGASASVSKSGSTTTVVYTSNGITQQFDFGGSVSYVYFQGRDKADSFYNYTSYTTYAYGGDENDVLRGGSGYNYLLGEGGQDTLYGKTTDYLDGGYGKDLVDRGFGLIEDDAAYDPTRIAVRGSGDANAIEVNDIQQGPSANCYFWASLAAVVDSGFDLLSNVRYVSGNTFQVELFIGTAWTWVNTTFDWRTGTYLPDDATFEKPIGNRGGDPYLSHDSWQLDAAEKDFWQLLIWRAWNSRFNEDDWGPVAPVLKALTGRDNLYSGKAYDSNAKTRILDSINLGRAVTICTSSVGGAGDKKNAVDPNGRIVSGHCYAVVGATSTHVEIFNPWHVEGSTAFFDKDGDNYLNATERAEYNRLAVQDGNDDGFFRITWADAARYFDTYTVNPA